MPTNREQLGESTSRIRLLVAFLDEAVWKPAKPFLTILTVLAFLGVLILHRDVVGMLIATIFLLAVALAVLWTFWGWLKHLRESWETAKERTS